MYRNPAVAELEYKISKLEHELSMYRRFYSLPPVSSYDEDPRQFNLKDKTLEFFRLAVASVSHEIDQNQYHFYSRVVTPPSMLTMNYYATEQTIQEARSAYDVMSYIQENLMHEFYKQLIEK